jgi:hypothetical protein
MTEQITLRGVVLPDGSLRLESPLPLPAGEVEVTVRPAPAAGPRESVMEVLDRVRAQQQARGHVSPTAEEIDAELRQMRDEWD